ncbi:hypothetical protein AB0K05_24735 [Nonomuraea sp. NPDC049486]|uniref:hypothetical protein n=1 Tax=Nonomuraea sp. NPDC049486 TaxID=3155773 RepID=UPI0034428285
MARLRTLTRTAIAGTATLWAATIATSITGHGSDRLHLTMLTASMVAAVIIIVLARENAVDARVAEIRADVCDTVRQAADELHTAVDAVRQDRATLTAVRTLTAELVHHRHEHRDRVA